MGRLRSNVTKPHEGENGQALSAFRDLLLNRDYAALWIGQLVSWVGNSFHRISLLFLLMAGVRPGERYIPLLTLLLVHTLAYLLLGPVAGVFVDRWDRKRTMIVSDLVRAVLVLCIPFARTHTQLYLLTFLTTVASLFFDPARNSALPHIVKPAQLFMANSFMSTSESIAETIGFFTGGVVVATLGYKFAFYYDSFSFIISAISVSFIALTLAPRVAGGEEGDLRGRIRRLFGDMGDGLRYVARKAEIASVFVLFFLMATSIGSVNYLLALFADSALGLGPAAYGAIAGALTLGYLVGSVCVGFLASEANKVTMLGFGLFGMGIGTVWIAQSPSLGLAMAGAFVGGLANPVYYVASRTYLQELVPDEVRGRVFSLQFLVVQIGFCGSVVIAGGLMTFLSVSAVLTVLGAALAVTGAIGPRLSLMARARIARTFTE